MQKALAIRILDLLACHKREIELGVATTHDTSKVVAQALGCSPARAADYIQAARAKAGRRSESL